MKLFKKFHQKLKLNLSLVSYRVMVLSAKICQLIGRYYYLNKRNYVEKYILKRIFKNKLILNGPFIIVTKDILKNKDPSEFEFTMTSNDLIYNKATAVIFKGIKTYKNSPRFGMELFDACINIKNINNIKYHIYGLNHHIYTKINLNKPVRFDGIIFTTDIHWMILKRRFYTYKN